MRRIVVCTVALLTLATWAGPAAEGLMIDVLDSSGNKVGFIDVDVHPDGGGVQGWFQSTVGQPKPSLDAAAQQCGEHHFNWFQVVVADSNPPDGLEPPYIDPPQGGLGGQWADGLPWYWDEEVPDDPLNTPGFDPIFQLGSQLDKSDPDPEAPFDQLRYEDFPQDAPGTEVTFVTWLVSLNEDGSVHSYHGGFTWTWEAEEGGGGGGGRELYWGTTYGAATLDPTPLSGDQAWYYHNLLVPEPSTFVMLAVVGLLACARRRRVAYRGSEN
jgi:hypothetical protein